jgi:biopolymer transport protein ExbD
MTRLAINYLKTVRLGVRTLAFLVVVTAIVIVPRGNAQSMQRGISVELAPTSSAVPVPDADNPDALIITVTDTAKIYFGVNQVTTASLAEKLKGHASDLRQSLYIKADARAPYSCVVKVLDAAHAAGIPHVTLLTTQPKGPQAGTKVLPEGIEMELAPHLPSVPR